MKKLSFVRSVCLIFVLALSSMQSFAATIVYDGGKISGVDSLSALGFTWDVTLHTGSELSVYPPAQYPFTVSGTDAANTLLSIFFQAEAPSATATSFLGCDEPSTCLIITPYQSGAGMYILYDAAGYVGIGLENTYPVSRDLASITFATWSFSAVQIPPPAPTVPVPAAVWLFGSGLLGLIGMARRKA